MPCPNASCDPPPMPRRMSNAVRVGVRPRVPVGGQQPGGDQHVGRDGRAADLDVAGGGPAHLGERRPVAQHLLDRPGDQPGVGAQLVPDARVLVEGAHRVAEQQRRRDVPGEQQQHGEVGGLLVVQGAPVDLGADQRGHQVVARVGAPGPAVLGQVAGDAGHRLGDLLGELRVGRVDLHREQLVGPGPEQPAILRRQPEQLGDHDHRQREGQRVDQVEPLPGRVQQLAGHLADPRLQAGHRPRRERGADQPAQRAVLRRVDRGQHAALHRLGRGEDPAGVGRERGRVPDHGLDVGVPEHVPDAGAVPPDRLVVAHPAQPVEQGRLVRGGGGEVGCRCGGHWSSWVSSGWRSSSMSW